jgi:acyl-CoA synthetase (NDP forming)
MQHALAPLLVPRSVALIGASERPGSLGRTVYENLMDGTYKGQVHAVKNRQLMARGAVDFFQPGDFEDGSFDSFRRWF